MRKSIIIPLIVLALIIVGGTTYMAYQGSLQKLTISFDTTGSPKLNLYKQSSKDSEVQRDKVIHTFTATETVSLQKGTYVIETSGENFSTNPTTITVGDSPVEKTIPVMYTDDYLARLLAKEKPSILQAIVTQFKNAQTLYSIQPGKLYGKGEWFGTALIYNGQSSDYRDTLHLVLRKNDNGTWTTVGTPNITLSAVDNPDVPSYILSEVNSYSASPSEAPRAPEPNYVINDGSRGAQ